MSVDKKKLKERLEQIWERPDFSSFFENKFNKKPFSIKKEAILFNEGDATGKIFFIKEGFVKLYRLSEDGRETIIYLYGPGSFLGVRALISNDKSHKHTAEALTDMEIVTVPRNEYFDVLASNPEYIVDFLHIFISRLNYTERRLQGFITTDTTARIAIFLSDVARRFCKEAFYKNEVISLPLKLTHQQIGEFVGALRETVTVSLNKLEKESIIKDEKGKITILELKRLNEYASNHRNNL